MQTLSSETNAQFEVHYKFDDETKLGYIERYQLPTGEIVHFGDDRINLELMKPYIGHMFYFYRNGVQEGPYELRDIAPTKTGVMAMHFDFETGENDEEESRI